MPNYYTCPWCNKEDDADFWYIPFEYYCNFCGKPIKIDISKMEEEEEVNDKHV